MYIWYERVNNRSILSVTPVLLTMSSQKPSNLKEFRRIKNSKGKEKMNGR